MKSSTIDIQKRIHAAAETTIARMADADAALGEALANNAGLSVAINSSFLFRDKRSVKTFQSRRRLAAKVSRIGKQIRAEDVSILDGSALKKHYRILSEQELGGLIPLQDAVSQEINSVGDLIFVLAGTVKGLRPSAQQVDGSIVSELRLAPSLSGDFEKVAAGVYATKSIMPIEELFSRINGDLAEQGGLPDGEGKKIARAYDELLDNAITDVIIPAGRKIIPEGTILGEIAGSLQRQAEEYSTALKALGSDGKADPGLNEVLRIAYNFTTDVMPLIFLFMSICDVKPIIFWCTVDTQWALSSAFASLPWSALGRKEKLEEYQQVVSHARNRAFHHVLPFDATVEVDLSHLDVRAESIRLFTPFGGKQERGVRLKDQALADLLGEFSRAKWRPVSNIFWQANLKVMEAASDLAQAILDTLILLHKAKKVA